MAMPELERAVLGAILADPEQFVEVAGILEPEDLVSPEGQRIWGAMTRADEAGMAPDVYAVYDELHRHGTRATPLELQELAEDCPTPSAAPHYAERVKADAMRRRGMLALGDGMQDLRQSREPDQALALLADQLLESATVRERAAQPLGATVAGALDALERRARGDDTGEIISTGYAALDRLLGGLHRGALYLVGARPGQGKTSLAASIARRVAGRGEPTVLFSLEMSTFEITLRLLCGDAGVSARRLQTDTASLQDWTNLVGAVEELSAIPLHVDDRPTLRVPDLRAAARRIPGLSLIVVDYIQLMTPSSRRQTRQEDVAEISRGLKLLAKELHVPVIACVQLSREVDKRSDRRPQLTDLRESGSLEQDADVVLFLHPRDAFPDQMEAIVAKHRNGPTDKVYLGFERRTTRFLDLPGLPDRAAGEV